jgi:hypothetical protein
LHNEVLSTGEQPGALARAVAERVAALPGVQAVGYADLLPLGPGLAPTSGFQVIGRPAQSEIEDHPVRRVSAGYFTAFASHAAERPLLHRRRGRLDASRGDHQRDLGGIFLAKIRLERRSSSARRRPGRLSESCVHQGRAAGGASTACRLFAIRPGRLRPRRSCVRGRTIALPVTRRRDSRGSTRSPRAGGDDDDGSAFGWRSVRIVAPCISSSWAKRPAGSAPRGIGKPDRGTARRVNDSW